MNDGCASGTETSCWSCLLNYNSSSLPWLNRFEPRPSTSQCKPNRLDFRINRSQCKPNRLDNCRLRFSKWPSECDELWKNERSGQGGTIFWSAWPLPRTWINSTDGWPS